MQFSSRIMKCGESPIRKFLPFALEAEKKGHKIYHLNIGQPDVITPPQFFETVREFNVPTLEYAPSPGMPELITAVRGYYAKLGVNYEDKDILITTGGSEALMITFQCILDAGDEILIPEPFYPNYGTIANLCDAVIRPIPTTPEEGYRYAVKEKIEPLINEKTRAILVTNPGNPTGVVLTEQEMQVIADIAKEHGLFLIADEAYREFYYDGGGLRTFATYDEIAENVIVCDTVSKRFSACGARIGCLITKNQALRAHALKFCQCRLSVSTLEQLGSAALYTVGPEYFAEVREEYLRRRDTLMEGLQAIPGAVSTVPQGAFYTMVALPVDDADKFQRWMLEVFEDNGDTVMVTPGAPMYRTPGRGANEVRIAYVLECDKIKRAVELLGKGIARYRKEVMGL